MLRVGLTGGIGSGKTTVADLLARQGAVIIDADLLAREVVARGTRGLALVEKEFGPDILTPDGDLDRAAVAQRVFADPDARRRLEAIIHPLVRERAAALEAAAPPDAVVVHVIPLLVETGQVNTFDVVVVVDVAEDVQITRLQARGMTWAEAKARMDAQASRVARTAAADIVIDNSGTPEDLERRVRDLWAELAARAKRAPWEGDGHG
jgi:dephospho-CoA kinase